jgi:hypothetical protein
LKEWREVAKESRYEVRIDVGGSVAKSEGRDLDAPRFTAYLKEFDDIILYHFHPKSEFPLESLMPSKRDLNTMVHNERIFSKAHAKGSLGHKLVSEHGVTTFTLNDEGRAALCVGTDEDFTKNAETFWYEMQTVRFKEEDFESVTALSKKAKQQFSEHKLYFDFVPFKK